jgi:hypothetical protein
MPRKAIFIVNEEGITGKRDMSIMRSNDSEIQGVNETTVNLVHYLGDKKKW